MTARGRWAALLLTAALAIVGCGGGDDQPAAETTPTATTPTTTTTPTTARKPPYATAPQAPRERSGSSGSGTESGGTPGRGSGTGGARPPSSGRGNGNGGARPPEDTRQDDSPPPAGSPAARYERYCNSHPHACD